MNLLKFLLRRPYWFLRFQLPVIVGSWKNRWKKWLRHNRHRLSTLSRQAKKRAVMRLFRECHGYEFDFRNPRTLNEKIAVRKLSDDPRIPILADKFAVREYVRKTVGEEYLVPLLFEGMTFTEEDFRKLPRQCVIKTTNACGTNILIFDKEKEDAKEIVRQVRQMQKMKFGYLAMELFYNRIPPRVIVEKLLTDADGEVPKDYKFHCFPNADGGRGKCFIQVISGRFGVQSQNFYNENWELYPFRRTTYPADPTAVRQPEKFLEMLEVARKLAGDWPYIRVDLYNTVDRIYFGEMTFTPGAATGKFDPPEWDAFWGKEWLT